VKEARLARNCGNCMRDLDPPDQSNTCGKLPVEYTMSDIHALGADVDDAKVVALYIGGARTSPPYRPMTSTAASHANQAQAGRDPYM